MKDNIIRFNQKSYDKQQSHLEQALSVQNLYYAYRMNFKLLQEAYKSSDEQAIHQLQHNLTELEKQIGQRTGLRL